MADRVRIQTEDFDLTQELADLRAGNRAVGAVCAFVGTVREWQNRLTRINHRPPIRRCRA